MVRVDPDTKQVLVDPDNSNKVLCADDCPNLVMDISLAYSQTILVSCLTGLASSVSASITATVNLLQCCLVQEECLCYADDFTHSCDCSDCFEIDSTEHDWVNRPFDQFDSGDWNCRGIWVGTATASITWCPGTVGSPGTSRAQFGVLLYRYCSGGSVVWRMGLGVYFPDDGLSSVDFGIGLSAACFEFTTCGWSFGGDAIELGNDLSGSHDVDQSHDTTTYHHEVSGNITISDVIWQVLDC